MPKWAPFAPNDTANQIAGNPGTTVVSIGHLTPWPENPGYRTQVWDKAKNHDACNLRRHHTHYDVNVMNILNLCQTLGNQFWCIKNNIYIFRLENVLNDI